MTDRDPYGRRRTPDDRDYQTPDWEDDASGNDPYDYQRARDPRRSPEQGGRSAGNPNDLYLPANDPYASSSHRQPTTPPYSQPDDRGNWSNQTSWPDRPYAPGGGRNPQREIQDPYAEQPAPQQRRQPTYDYDEYGQAEELDGWEEEQRRSRRPQRPPRADYEEDYRRRPSITVPAGLTNAIAGQDRRLLAIVLGTILSLIAMVAVVALRADAVGWFPLHINAAGEATKWGSESALWRLPFTVGMITVMNLFAGFVLGMRDRKLSWLMIVSLPALHVLGWIALILIAW
jgi:hypothetical protein